VLEQFRAWLPAPVMLLADRFYPCAALFEWMDRASHRANLIAIV
jgi:hypothetical protein